MLQERYKETDSPLVREEIEQYMTSAPLPGLRRGPAAPGGPGGAPGRGQPQRSHRLTVARALRLVRRPRPDPPRRPRSPGASSKKSPSASVSWRKWVWITSPWTGPPAPWPAARPSASVWPPRSAPNSAASSISWMSPASACTPGIPSGSSNPEGPPGPGQYRDRGGTRPGDHPGQADYVVDMGPGAGRQGGVVVFEGRRSNS